MATRTVSICGQPQDGQPQDGQAQDGQAQGGAVYRYGRPGHVELEVSGLHRTLRGESGGGETQVYTDTATHRYIVYDQIVRTGFGPDGHFDPSETEGLLVQRGGRTVSSRTCARTTRFHTRLLDLLPQGDHVPH